MNIPLATYRLQLHAGFDFDAAAGIAGYLRDLGISHAYCSPCLQAVAGSEHGYDVVDCHRVSADLGGEAARERFCGALASRGLGQVLDIVPNHMAISRGNAWWWDTLENGVASRYAPYFDIEWNAPEERLRNKIMLPLLEDHSGRVIEAGKLKLERTGGSFIFRYYDRTFPVAPDSMAPLLAECAGSSGNGELALLADSLARLPAPGESDWENRIAHHRDKEAIRELLARLCSEQPEIARGIDAAVEEVNRSAGALDDLLLRQNYRLSRWRTASTELVYRRFFDINTLVGMRVEDERVFRDTHQLIFEWVRSAQIDGLRVDHPDGLRDPERYFQRLRAAAPETWIVAEKILQPGEKLPPSWKIAGTTGYDFLNLAGGLFIDPHGEAPLNEFYREFTGEPVDFEAAAYEKKAFVLREILGSDVNRLAALLVQICEGHRNFRDYTRHELHEAIREVASCFRVYRTYVRAPEKSITRADAQAIRDAVERAVAKRPDLDSRLFEFIQDILLLRIRGEAETELVMRLQQLTAAVMAKGVEDTAFYSYLRLVSLNEVGGNPGHFGVPVEEFHKWCCETQASTPDTLLATSTHDTKRSEDVRARIGLLSETPSAWAEAVARWSAINSHHRSGDLPDRKTEYFWYQTLVGAWPLSAERASAYLLKAVREARERTSWTEPNAAYEEALGKFIGTTLTDPEFVADFEAFLRTLVEPARAISLSLTLLKYSAPGIPDLYQGTELWDLSLVDPDNRRPVDYDLRRRLLAELDDLPPERIVERVADRQDPGIPKLWTIRQCLRARRRFAHCFGAGGAYRPLWASGPKAAHLVAFARGDDVIAAAPRWLMSLGNWDDTTLEIPEGSWRNEMTGQTVEAGKARIGDLFRRFPVALLTRQPPA